jgi:hypothetical protein
MENAHTEELQMKPLLTPSGNRETVRSPAGFSDSSGRTRSTAILKEIWKEGEGLPGDVAGILTASGNPIFAEPSILMAIAGYQVPIPPFERGDSRSDLFLLVRTERNLTTIMVEGIAEEDFGPRTCKWLTLGSEEKQELLDFMRNTLELPGDSVEEVRYRLLYHTASAVAAAARFNARNALLLVHSFSDRDTGFNDYREFVSLFGIEAAPNTLSGPRLTNGVDLYFTWIRGGSGSLQGPRS